MKVVLFCGGLGMRMRGADTSAPKPMMPIGERPVLWHVMRYYAHYGHTDFILCLGYGGRAVKDYFLHYDETASNDFVLRDGGRDIELLSSDISDWKITFVDTGHDTAIGERLRRVQQFLADDELFLANYGDVLTDAPIDDMVRSVVADPTTVGTMLAIPPVGTFHVVQTDEDDKVTGFVPAVELDIRINGGYFVLRRDIFDYLNEGEDLVGDACVRAATDGRLNAYRYDGFWAPMDTLKERLELEELLKSGKAPWLRWSNHDDGAFDVGAPVVPA